MKLKDYVKQLIIEQCPTNNLIDIVNLLDRKTDFFTAPASTKYHLSFEGGLAVHTLGVIHNIVDQYNSGLLNMNLESAIKCALLHDLCKTGYYELREDGTYSYNKDIKGHGDRSLILADELGIKLTDKERALIRFHMGPFAPSNTTRHIDEIKDLKEAKEKLNEIALYQNTYSIAVSKHPEILSMYWSDHKSSVEEQNITKEKLEQEIKKINNNIR